MEIHAILSHPILSLRSNEKKDRRRSEEERLAPREEACLSSKSHFISGNQERKGKRERERESERERRALCICSVWACGRSLTWSLIFAMAHAYSATPLAAAAAPSLKKSSARLRHPSLLPESLRLQPVVLSSRSRRGVTSPSASIRSERLWTPSSAVANDIWSIRSDLEVPTSMYAGPYANQGGQGPPPMVQERFQSVITQLFHHRIIRCGGAVDDDMANLIVAQLLYLDATDPNRDIIMYVNSPGGSVTAGMAIFDTMRHIRPDVSTVCVGLAASMGAFLLSGGTKGKRYSLPNSRIMIHQPLGGAQGQQTDIEIQANEILHHKANLNGYLAYHTGQPLEKIVTDTDRDFFMSAKEAKDYGLIDSVISNPLKALQPLPAPAPAPA